LKRSMTRRRKEGDGKIKRVVSPPEFRSQVFVCIVFRRLSAEGARCAGVGEVEFPNIFNAIVDGARNVRRVRVRRLYACANISTLRRYPRFSALNRPFDLPIVGDRRRPFPHPSRPGPRPRWWSAMVSTATARRGRSIPIATRRMAAPSSTEPRRLAPVPLNRLRRGRRRADRPAGDHPRSDECDRAGTGSRSVTTIPASAHPHLKSDLTDP
jgi:hypothetical protein